LTLEDAMRRAQIQSTEARALSAAIGEADSRIDEARSAFWPRVDMSESVQRGDQPAFVFSSLLSQRRLTAATFAIPALTHPDPVTNIRTTVTLEQVVFDAGSTRRTVEAAQLDRERAVANKGAADQDLALRAANAFVRVLQLEASLRATDAAVATAESDRHRAGVHREVGLVTEADALAMDVHLADMRQRRIAVAGDPTVARLQLADVVGLPLTETLALVPPAARPAPTDEAALVREALARHPEVQQATVQLQRAENGRRAARAALWPTVGVQGGWELNGATVDAPQSSWVIGAGVRVNVFRGFADTARIAEAAHAQVRATAEREGVERRIEVEVRGALAQLAAARAREEAGRSAVAQAHEAQRITRDRYESGLATVTDVLRAAEATLDGESRATAAEMDVILQTVALDRALGRLSETASRAAAGEQP
jgi:outer membrane protein TolC